MSFGRTEAALLFFAVGSVFVAKRAAADAFPNREVQLVVPFPPGGGVDTVARIVADKLSKQWAQTVIVVNRAGANGNIGAEFVVRAKPDGYTALFSPSPIYTTAKALYPRLPFDPETALKSVTIVASTPNVVMANPALPIKTLGELQSYAKQHKGELSYASQGIGSTAHLTLANLASVAGIEMLHVPYRGAAPADNAVAAGQTSMTADGLTSSLGLIKGGAVRGLFIASPRRSPLLPDVPTAMEFGLPNFDSQSWYGVSVPEKTPDDVIAKLRSAIVDVLKKSDVQTRLTGLGLNVIASSPAEMTKFIQTDSAKWKAIIDEQHITLE